MTTLTEKKPKDILDIRKGDILVRIRLTLKSDGTAELFEIERAEALSGIDDRFGNPDLDKLSDVNRMVGHMHIESMRGSVAIEGRQLSSRKRKFEDDGFKNTEQIYKEENFKSAYPFPTYRPMFNAVTYFGYNFILKENGYLEPYIQSWCCLEDVELLKTKLKGLLIYGIEREVNDFKEKLKKAKKALKKVITKELE